MSFWGQIGWKTCFWEIWVEFKCIGKKFNLILMHFIHKTMCFKEFLHWNALFLKKKIEFSNFWSIKSESRPIKNAIKILVTICLARLVLDWCWIDQIYSSIDWSLFSTDWIFVWRCFKKSFLKCSSYLFKIYKHFLIVALRPIQSKPFLSLSSLNFSRVFVLKCR